MNTEDQTPNKYPRYDEAFKRVAKLMRQAGDQSPTAAAPTNRLLAQAQPTPVPCGHLLEGGKAKPRHR